MKLFAASLAVALASIAGGNAVAEDYPSKAIRIITANSVGGTSDIFVRGLAEKLQRACISRSSSTTGRAAR